MGMLVLQRYVGEQVIITTPDGTRIVVTACQIGDAWGDKKVRLGFEAPHDVRIDRKEVDEQRKKAVLT